MLRCYACGAPLKPISGTAHDPDCPELAKILQWRRTRALRTPITASERTIEEVRRYPILAAYDEFCPVHRAEPADDCAPCADRGDELYHEGT